MEQRHRMPADAKELPTTGADKISRPASQPADSSQIGSLAHKQSGTIDTDQRFAPEGQKNGGTP